MLECNRTVLERLEPAIHGVIDDDSELIGRVLVELGAEVVRSRILGPAIIGRDTVIADSYVGPFTSIQHNCTIEDTEIEYSIVLADCWITGVRRIESALMGREVEVTPASAAPRAHRLVLGDHSRVQITS
jgi:glucose-1-phosphate thymidylyltransferase